MLNLFKKKKESKKVATAADFNNSGIGMALKVMPFLPLALLVLSMALSAFSPKGDAIADNNDVIEIVDDQGVSAYINSYDISGALSAARSEGYAMKKRTDKYGRVYYSGFNSSEGYLSIGLTSGRISEIAFSWDDPYKFLYSVALDSARENMGENGTSNGSVKYPGYVFGGRGLTMEVYHSKGTGDTWLVLSSR